MPETTTATRAGLPSRLHHNAFVTRDMEATRRFYEEVLGLPLIATWCESDELFGKLRTYCHCFFGLGDGSALAFFQFASEDDAREFAAKTQTSPFVHIALKVDPATQKAIEARVAKAGYQPPDTYVLEHGYCRSVYVKDPNGLVVEFACDSPDAEAINKVRLANARKDLARWLAGDHTSNNVYRSDEHAT